MTGVVYLMCLYSRLEEKPLSSFEFLWYRSFVAANLWDPANGFWEEILLKTVLLLRKDLSNGKSLRGLIHFSLGFPLIKSCSLIFACKFNGSWRYKIMSSLLKNINTTRDIQAGFTEYSFSDNIKFRDILSHLSKEVWGFFLCSETSKQLLAFCVQLEVLSPIQFPLIM